MYDSTVDKPNTLPLKVAYLWPLEPVFIAVLLLFNVHGKQQWSYRDGQLIPGQV